MTTQLSIVRETPLPVSLRSLNSPRRFLSFYDKVIAADPMHDPEKEAFHLICLNTRLGPKSWHLISLGTVDGCNAHPRDIFRPALVAGAHGIALIHNHPSGDPAPSRIDEGLTLKVSQGAKLLGLRFVDHLIVTRPKSRKRLFSFCEADLL